MQQEFVQTHRKMPQLYYFSVQQLHLRRWNFQDFGMAP